MKKRKHENKPTPTQSQIFAAELTDLLKHVLLVLPIIQRVEDEMGAGYPGSTLNDGRGGDDGLTLVERLANNNIDGTYDPAHAATEALTEFDEMVAHLRRVDRIFRQITPMTTEQAKALDQWHREAETPVCGLCQLPIIEDTEGKAKKIDDTSFHRNTCYFKVWRTRRDAAS